jgi:putative transcriptional regulator
MIVRITLDEVLKKRNMRLRELHTLTGINYNRLSQFKLGKISQVKLKVVVKICTALQCDIAELFQLTEEKSPGK